MQQSNKIHNRAKKSLGQHFLTNKLFLHQIAKAGLKNLTSNDAIVEIGPGKGALTEYLLHTEQAVFSIETDKDLIGYLKEKFNVENFTLIHADALNYDFSQIPGQKKLVANLPYNISVPLILNYLQNLSLFSEYSVLIQKEVALRLKGTPNTKDYGRLAVLTQAFCEVKLHFDVPGNAFKPTTKVTSSFVTLKPHDRYNVAFENVDFNKLSYLLEKCFAQRRKMIRAVLKNYPEILQILLSENIPETNRAEDITVEQYIKASKKL